MPSFYKKHSMPSIAEPSSPLTSESSHSLSTGACTCACLLSIFYISFLSSILLLLLVKQITLSVLPFYIQLLDGERRCLLLQTSPISSATVLQSNNSNQACTMLCKFAYVVALMAATAYAQNNNNNNNNNNGGQGGANGLTLLANAVQSASAKDGSGAASFVAEQAKSLTSTNNFINFCAGKTLTNGLQVQGGSCNGIGKSKSERICRRWLIGHSHGRYSVQK